MTREEVFDYCRQQYKTEPDYPWKDYNAVLRHSDNNKWYGLVMTVSFYRSPDDHPEAVRCGILTADYQIFRRERWTVLKILRVKSESSPLFLRCDNPLVLSHFFVYQETEPDMRLGAASIGIMTDDNYNIFEDGIDLMVGGRMMPVPAYPEYEHNPELLEDMEKIKYVLDGGNLSYRPSPHRFIRTNRPSTYAMDEMIEEAKQGLRREFPKHGKRTEYTVDWLEVRRKALELYKQIYGRKGVAGMVYFDPDLVSVETAECKNGWEVPVGKKNCVKLLCFEEQQSTAEDLICTDPAEAKGYVRFASGYCTDLDKQVKQWKREYGTDEPMEIVRDIYKETPHVHRAYREILGQHAVFRMEGQIDDYMDMVKDKLASSAPDIEIGAKTQRIEKRGKSYSR